MKRGKHLGVFTWAELWLKGDSKQFELMVNSQSFSLLTKDIGKGNAHEFYQEEFSGAMRKNVLPKIFSPCQRT